MTSRMQETASPSDKAASAKDLYDEIDLDVLTGAVSYYIRVLNLWVSRDLEKKLAGLPVVGGTGKSPRSSWSRTAPA